MYSIRREDAWLPRGKLEGAFRTEPKHSIVDFLPRVFSISLSSSRIECTQVHHQALFQLYPYFLDHFYSVHCLLNVYC